MQIMMVQARLVSSSNGELAGCEVLTFYDNLNKKCGKKEMVGVGLILHPGGGQTDLLYCMYGICLFTVIGK